MEILNLRKLNQIWKLFLVQTELKGVWQIKFHSILKMHKYLHKPVTLSYLYAEYLQTFLNIWSLGTSKIMSEGFNTFLINIKTLTPGLNQMMSPIPPNFALKVCSEIKNYKI